MIDDEYFDIFWYFNWCRLSKKELKTSRMETKKLDFGIRVSRFPCRGMDGGRQRQGRSPGFWNWGRSHGPRRLPEVAPSWKSDEKYGGNQLKRPAVSSVWKCPRVCLAFQILKWMGQILFEIPNCTGHRPHLEFCRRSLDSFQVVGWECGGRGLTGGWRHGWELPMVKRNTLVEGQGV